MCLFSKGMFSGPQGLKDRPRGPQGSNMPNLSTKILDVRGFDSSISLILRGGLIMSIGSFPEVLSQQILVVIILVGRFGVVTASTS